MSAKNSNVSTAVTALILCLVCSVMVSAVAVGLKSKQQENARLDLNKNILMAADMYDPETDSSSVIPERFADFDVRLVNLQTGKFATDQEISAAGINDVDGYDVSKAARTPYLSTSLVDDIAKIGGKPNFAKVYLAKDANGEIDQIVLPIHGAGLWGPIFGLLTLDKDLNTVKGVNFYQHKETPGLGSRIEEPQWQETWVDKELYNEDGSRKIAVVKAGTAREGQVDGISGATLTIRGVNNLLQYWIGEDGYKPFLDNLKAGQAGNGEGV
ncbi:Na(+)-translocating NADH-quinone reductase subunit C [Moraxella ovis]|uniref:Na(+)-translocating NADH-quinone reductase subunit C n=1 Tax=Moraxella ovis TaxID=29433 RepID=A0A160GDV8_9GAMM|nr:Na(+)-translocating NADH-quinone reductase subunit C [Moraxella ovis]ANB90997.1 Na(+)-translocating NADH-quinone reductase subunit C [Moraxella ovis]SPX83130.1 Na(+)-translocating NADH-quinone reductase subunit C [Moraxella ovis]STY86465.1 Na(+)-translocating NADH-quinone reductase subunit C [Moraxella ovis]STZ06513.1 Na(+)-translocating NADH-quinone reductase subunit C [Moraxella ovis]